MSGRKKEWPTMMGIGSCKNNQHKTSKTSCELKSIDTLTYDCTLEESKKVSKSHEVSRCKASPSAVKPWSTMAYSTLSKYQGFSKSARQPIYQRGDGEGQSINKKSKNKHMAVDNPNSWIPSVLSHSSPWFSCSEGRSTMSRISLSLENYVQ